jgi:hypothetical protein
MFATPITCDKFMRVRTYKSILNQRIARSMNTGEYQRDIRLKGTVRQVMA